MSTMPLARTVHYPESDGRPMGETQAHAKVMVDLLSLLERHYADVPDVYVWGNMFLYYKEGNPRACVAPDVFLVKGVDKRLRRTYKLWEEGRAPSFVLEITSKDTKGEDTRDKKGVYQSLGVEEYFLFDPLGEYLRPRLQGYRLVGGRYEELAPEGDGSLVSRTAGLRLAPEGLRLRLREAATGEPLLWDEEQAEAVEQEKRARQAAEGRAEDERLARQAAEERIRLLEEELASLRGGSPDRYR